MCNTKSDRFNAVSSAKKIIVKAGTRLLIDRELLGEAYIGVHPCVNTSSLKLRLSDLLEKFLPAVDHGYTVVDLEG